MAGSFSAGSGPAATMGPRSWHSAILVAICLTLRESGETYDVGKVALLSTVDRLEGRVVGSDGKPVSDAVVFTRGVRRETVVTSPIPTGDFISSRSREDKPLVYSEEGYRFTGVELAGDIDKVAVTLKGRSNQRTVEASEAGQLRAGTGRCQTNLGSPLGKIRRECHDENAIECILAMESIDQPLALEWATERGWRPDIRIRQPIAEAKAETDVQETLAYLATNRDRRTQTLLVKLADRFRTSDPKKANRFADEALVTCPSTR